MASCRNAAVSAAGGRKGSAAVKASHVMAWAAERSVVGAEESHLLELGAGALVGRRNGQRGRRRACVGWGPRADPGRMRASPVGRSCRDSTSLA